MKTLIFASLLFTFLCKFEFTLNAKSLNVEHKPKDTLFIDSKEIVNYCFVNLDSIDINETVNKTLKELSLSFEILQYGYKSHVIYSNSYRIMREMAEIKKIDSIELLPLLSIGERYIESARNEERLIREHLDLVIRYSSILIEPYIIDIVKENLKNNNSVIVFEKPITNSYIDITQKVIELINK